MSQKLVQSRFVTGPDDALASGDVYEVSENAIRSRAEGLSDELITELLGALKIPFDPLIDFLEDVKDFVAAILEALWDRVLDLLALLPPSIGKALGEIDITSALLGYASLNLAWDYEGELIHVDPKHGSTLQAVKDTLKKSRRAKGLDANRVPDAIDQGAETIIFTEFIKRVIASDMAPPLDEILDLISSDTIIQDVCENVFPSVFDPTGKGGIDPSAAPGVQPGDKETGVANPSEGPFNRPGYTAGGGFADNPNAPDVDNPWESGERGGSVGGEGTAGNGGVTVNPNPQSPIDWDEAPDKPYWDQISPEGGGGGGTYRPGTTTDPGVRDNLPPWLNPTEEMPGYNWDIVDEIMKNVRPEVVVARRPGIVSMILHYYAFPSGDFDLGEEYTRLVNLLSWLKSDWATAKTRDATLGKLLYFSSASADAQHLFTAYPETDFLEEALIAKSYRYNDIGSLLKVQYPRLVI